MTWVAMTCASRSSLAASNLGALEAQTLTAALHRNLKGLPEWTQEDQKTVIQGITRKVEVAAGQPIKLTLVVPGVVRRCVLEWLPRLDSNQK